MLGPAILVIAGVATHQSFFAKGEHHMLGLFYLQIYAGLLLVTVLCCLWVDQKSRAATLTASTFTIYYLAGLYGSLVLSRIFWSPLYHFPGPPFAKLSSLYFSYQCRKGNAHEVLLKLHQQYGDFVRFGSSDLSIIHPKAVSAIYGRTSRCIKAAWYDLNHPRISMQTTRERHAHDDRRRVWGSAFVDGAMSRYEKRIATYQDQLLSRFALGKDSTVNVKELFGLYNYDVMGDLAFGASFEALRSNEQHWAVKLLHRSLQPIGWMLPIWLFRLLLSIPGATGDFMAFMVYCCQRLDQRMAVSSCDAATFCYRFFRHQSMIILMVICYGAEQGRHAQHNVLPTETVGRQKAYNV